MKDLHVRFAHILTVLLVLIASAASTWAVTYDYDEAGRLVRVQHDNGMETRYTYDKNGNLTSRVTDVTNAVHEGEASATEIVVAPSPSTNWARISIPDWQGATVSATMYDVEGAVVQRVTRTLGDGTTSLDVRHLPSGAYRLVVTNGDALRTIALVVTK